MNTRLGKSFGLAFVVAGGHPRPHVRARHFQLPKGGGGR